MAKFKFKLDALLRMRTREEDRCRCEVAALDRERTALEDSLRQRQQRIGAARQTVRSELVGTIAASTVRMQANASLAIMRDAQKVVLELAGLHRRLVEARGRLKDASVKRRAIELLRDRRHEIHRKEIARREQAQQDALAITKAAQQRWEESL